MRVLVLSLMLMVLAGCDAGSAAQVDAHETPVRALTGPFKPASDTARQVTGGVDIQRAGLLFDAGVVLYTRTLNPRVGSDVASTSGDSYAALAVRPADVHIELRRVTQQSVRHSAVGLCGDDEPYYVALAYDRRETEVTVLVFAGDELPGPRATQSRLCATFAYAAPNGARTQQGVVLW